MTNPKPTAKQPGLDSDTVYGAEDDLHDGKALLAQALASVLTEDAGFPAEIVRRGRTYALAGVKLRHERVMEDLAYIREYLRQCSKSIDWPAGRLLGEVVFTWLRLIAGGAPTIHSFSVLPFAGVPSASSPVGPALS